ncbi:hypothetical protein [Bradyrhizobium liaoningense]
MNFDDIGFGHGCSFAERIGAPVKRLRSGLWLGDQQLQQAPVATETQRRIMPLRMSLLTRWSFDVMRRLSARRSSFDVSNIEGLTRSVNEMAIHICRGRVRALLCAQAAAAEIISR